MVAFTVTTNAQTKVWDFGGDPTYTSAAQIALWPIVAFSAAENTTVVKDNLSLVGDNSGDKFGKIENAGGKTWDAGTSDEYTAINRFKFEGSAGDLTVVLPTYSYLSFDVTGDVDVKIWYRASGDSERTLQVSDGTNILSSITTLNQDPGTLSASKTGAGTIYIFGAGNSFNLYKIEVKGTGADALLSVKTNTAVKTSMKAIGDRIFVSNVDTNTEIHIYSITGALVKKINTNKNTDFTMKTGLWIAKIKTDKGEKSLKLITE